MIKKLREIMDKEEGFTLVELLAVIVILGIIMAIAVPSIGNVITNTQTKADEAEQELIVDAARLAMIDVEGVDSNENAHVTVADLVSKGYLEDIRKGGNKATDVVNRVDGKYVYSSGAGEGKNIFAAANAE